MARASVVYPSTSGSPDAESTGGLLRTTLTARRADGAGEMPAGTSGTTRTTRVPSAKSSVAASAGATVREGRSKNQRVVPDAGPARQAPVTSHEPSPVRWASQ